MSRFMQSVGQPKWFAPGGVAPRVAKALVALGLAGAAAFAAQAQVLPESGPLGKQSVSRLLLVDAERHGNRVVAVGDRGYILVSDDNGESWRRAKSPAAPLLSAVTFVDAKHGWAVGHDAVILASTDGGETWTKQFSAESEQRPLLDVMFLDPANGFAVGAYGAFYQTADGGKTWNGRQLLPPPPAPARGKASAPAGRGAASDEQTDEDRHLNAIVKLADGKLLVVGEAGKMARSDDGGKTWSRVEAPYKGSFFGAVQAQDGSVIVFGLRGRIYRADATLKGWKQVESASQATLMGGSLLPDGSIVLAGAAGTVLVSRDNGQSFSRFDSGTTRAFSKALLGGPNSVLALGEAGARDLIIPAARR
ncbi:MAG: hypothetical protein SF172_14990 [Burkholderiales bacterium]|nr:hypothetical protein [Burkholderiales bacterium]